MQRIKYSSIFVILVLILNISCVPVKKLSYFNDINELQEPGINPRIQKLILPFDKLYITVISIDPQTNLIFNSNQTPNLGTQTSGLLGYLVDEKGNISFPFVGEINVVGLTTSQAATKIQKALGEYVANTTILVKYIDNKVTVVGEVQQQGVYEFTQDKLNIYQAIALGGGITRYGNRKNLVLIRNEGDKIMHYRIDLSDSKISSREHYYIYPNDVIVVEPLKAISSSYANQTYLTILSTVSTLIAIILLIQTVK